MQITSNSSEGRIKPSIEEEKKQTNKNESKNKTKKQQKQKQKASVQPLGAKVDILPVMSYPQNRPPKEKTLTSQHYH